MSADIQLVSFGYGHGPAPAAHITYDVRHHFKDPHVRPELRALTADDQAVRAAVLGTPGIVHLLSATVAAVHAFRRGPVAGPVTVAIGCVGGRHRSAVLANEAARWLAASGALVSVTHRDMGRAVIERTASGSGGQS